MKVTTMLLSSGCNSPVIGWYKTRSHWVRRVVDGTMAIPIDATGMPRHHSHFRGSAAAKERNNQNHLPRGCRKIARNRNFQMNKPTMSTIPTRLRWGGSFLVLIFLVLQVIPRAFAERDASRRSSDIAITLLKQHEMLKQQSASSVPLDPTVCSSWTPTGSLNTARDSHTATLLPNGMVLVAGGFGPVRASAELYDPASGTWMPTGSLNTARAQHTATLLPNGMVLVAGGFDSNVNVSASAELYDPASGTWTPTGNLNMARTSHTATLLPNGMVLVAGGFGVSGDLASAELY